MRGKRLEDRCTPVWRSGRWPETTAGCFGSNVLQGLDLKSPEGPVGGFEAATPPLGGLEHGPKRQWKIERQRHGHQELYPRDLVQPPVSAPAPRLLACVCRHKSHSEAAPVLAMPETSLTSTLNPEEHPEMYQELQAGNVVKE